MLGCWARRLTMPCRRVATAKLSSWSTHCMPPASPVLALRAPASTCAAAAAAFGAVVTSCSCQSGAAKLPPAFEDVLKKIDADGDGTVSKEGVLAMFKRMDVDHDGKVTKTEFVATLGQCGVAPAAAEEIFKALDADGSGSLSQGEFEKFRDGPGRNVAYARGFVQSFLTKGRFVAYTSDIGESARPVMPRWFVNACYGLTFLYVGVSVAHETHEAHSAGASTAMTARAAVHATTFEVIASVLMPSLIIHQAVHFAQHHAHRLPPGPLTKWAPTLVGLCCIPFLPYLDPPAEHAIDAAFEYAWPPER